MRIRWWWSLCLMGAMGCAEGGTAEEEADASLPTPVCSNGYTVGPERGRVRHSRDRAGGYRDPDEPFEEPQLDNSDIEEARTFF